MGGVRSFLLGTVGRGDGRKVSSIVGAFDVRLREIVLEAVGGGGDALQPRQSSSPLPRPLDATTHRRHPLISADSPHRRRRWAFGNRRRAFSEPALGGGVGGGGGEVGEWIVGGGEGGEGGEGVGEGEALVGGRLFEVEDAEVVEVGDGEVVEVGGGDVVEVGEDEGGVFERGSGVGLGEVEGVEKCVEGVRVEEKMGCEFWGEDESHATGDAVTARSLSPCVDSFVSFDDVDDVMEPCPGWPPLSLMGSGL
ncbi:hypothetical protein HDU67_002543 [Dinochytrium kinnereticum]|nr:hypothetical protein HDU67_002543 [Dinochytrium kinnereticum]